MNFRIGDHDTSMAPLMLSIRRLKAQIEALSQPIVVAEERSDDAPKRVFGNPETAIAFVQRVAIGTYARIRVPGSIFERLIPIAELTAEQVLVSLGTNITAIDVIRLTDGQEQKWRETRGVWVPSMLKTRLVRVLRKLEKRRLLEELLGLG